MIETSSPSPATHGRWAVVAGASEGLGEAFARALAAQGHDLVLIARRQPRLETLAAELQQAYDSEVRCLSLDLADPSCAERLGELSGLDVGVAVYNAAYAPVGAFIEQPLDRLLQVVDVNVRGPLIFARVFGAPMAARGRGGLVLVSSLAGLQGSPRLAAYSATKAFNIALAEALWFELRPVQVLVCCAGAIRTPGYAAASEREAPGTLDASVVAETTLAALGRGPRVVPGWVNRLASLVMPLLGRRRAITLMANNTRDLQ